MKDRLIELLQKADKRCNDTKQCEGCVGFGKGGECVNYLIADHLLAAGVIVPPVSIIGQTVYIPWNYGGAKGITFCEVTHIITDYKKSYVRTNFSTDDEGFWEAFNGGQFAFEDFGKIVFTTREEAEKALAERSENEHRNDN